MVRLLSSIRYLTIIVPFAVTMYLESIDSYSYYVLCLLILIGLVQFSRLQTVLSYYPLRIIEAAFSAWVYTRFEGILFICMYSVLLSVFTSKRDSPHPLLMLLTWGMLGYVMLHQDTALQWTAHLLFAVVGCFGYLIHYAFKEMDQKNGVYDELRQKHYELEYAKRRLTQQSRHVSDLAQREERNRISREIHDDLGHQLIRIKMMSEAALHVYPQQPQKSIEMFAEVRDQLTLAMERLRSTVRKLKPDDKELQRYSIDRLVHELSNSAGLDIRYKIEGVPYPLYPSEEFVLYRNTQEAVSNAVKHGNATQVEVSLQFHTSAIVLAVRNNGTLPDRIHDYGLGLSGMEERVRIFGGSIEIQLNPAFEIRTVLPRNWEAIGS